MDKLNKLDKLDKSETEQRLLKFIQSHEIPKITK